MSEKFHTHYTNLKINEDATIEVINGAYRYLIQKWHPDKNPDQRQEAERITRIVNAAYAVLSDPESRKEYDKSLREEREKISAQQTEEAERVVTQHVENIKQYGDERAVSGFAWGSLLTAAAAIVVAMLGGSR